MQPAIEASFDPATSTISYIVYDEPGGTCAIIDPASHGGTGGNRTIAAARRFGADADAP